MIGRLSGAKARREEAPLVKRGAGSSPPPPGTAKRGAGSSCTTSRGCVKSACIVVLAALSLASGIATYSARLILKDALKDAHASNFRLQKDLIAARSAADNKTWTHDQHTALVAQLHEQSSKLAQKYAVESAARADNEKQLREMIATHKAETEEHVRVRATLKEEERIRTQHEAKLAAHAAQAAKWHAVQAGWDSVNELLASSFDDDGGAADSRPPPPPPPPPLDAAEIALLETSTLPHSAELAEAIAKLPVKDRVVEFYRELGDATKDAALLLAGHGDDEAGLIREIIAKYGAGALAKSDVRLVAAKNASAVAASTDEE